LKKVVVLEFCSSTAILESVSLAIAMNRKSRCDAEYCNFCAVIGDHTFCFLAPKYFKVIWLSKILALGVSSNGIPETHRVNYIGYLRFYYIAKYLRCSICLDNQ
jgi:hypothetical protein